MFIIKYRGFILRRLALRERFSYIRALKTTKSVDMQTYILLTKLAPEATYQLKDRAKTSHDWYTQVKNKCPDVKFIAHYALLGQYDFLDIYEAPDEETAAKISMISRANGALYAESLIAIPHKRFLELTEDISDQYDSLFDSYLKKKRES